MSATVPYRRMVDITGRIHTGMWHYADPYFPPEVYALPAVDWLPEPIYSEAMHMPMQTGTYVETAAHVRKDAVRLDAVGLERTVLLPSVCVQIPKGSGESIGAAELSTALGRLGSPGRWTGMGLLVSTGWGDQWDEPGYIDNCPYFEDDAIDVVLTQQFSLFGGDSPRFENPTAPSGHLRRFFTSDALLLAPLAHLTEVGDAVGHLIAAPLSITDISASPVRAVWIDGVGL